MARGKWTRNALLYQPVKAHVSGDRLARMPDLGLSPLVWASQRLPDGEVIKPDDLF